MKRLLSISIIVSFSLVFCQQAFAQDQDEIVLVKSDTEETEGDSDIDFLNKNFQDAKIGEVVRVEGKKSSDSKSKAQSPMNSNAKKRKPVKSQRMQGRGWFKRRY